MKEQAISKLNAEERDELNPKAFAFPKQRKEPIEDAGHVRAALARFDQATGVSDPERDEAFEVATEPGVRARAGSSGGVSDPG